jgi:site-specific DNA-methyltransferase (adenine-specific)
MIEISNEDNMQLMARYPDNHFDLAIVDPPYGIDKKFKGGKSGKINFNEIVDKEWDKLPTEAYFNELFRISKNQVIWGGNYFLDYLSNTRCVIIWDKCISEDFSLAMCEIAWTSFDKLAKIYKYNNPKNGKIHPTQKPVSLYSWIIKNYAKEGDKILDTHIGSGSIAIAVDNANKIDKMNLTLVGCELDKDYYNATMKRIKEQTSWQSLF